MIVILKPHGAGCAKSLAVFQHTSLDIFLALNPKENSRMKQMLKEKVATVKLLNIGLSSRIPARRLHVINLITMC